MHEVPIIYMNRKQLKRHLYFVHRDDDEDVLNLFGFQGQLIEQLCCECRGTLFEYDWARSDYERYLNVHEADSEKFQAFLNLNNFYEVKWVNEQFIIGQNLMRDYQKSIMPALEDDEDSYLTMIKKARDESWQGETSLERHPRSLAWQHEQSQDSADPRIIQQTSHAISILCPSFVQGGAGGISIHGPEADWLPQKTAFTSIHNKGDDARQADQEVASYITGSWVHHQHERCKNEMRLLQPPQAPALLPRPEASMSERDLLLIVFYLVRYFKDLSQTYSSRLVSCTPAFWKTSIHRN